MKVGGMVRGQRDKRTEGWCDDEWDRVLPRTDRVTSVHQSRIRFRYNILLFYYYHYYYYNYYYVYKTPDPETRT